jgi:hypothetical protein
MNQDDIPAEIDFSKGQRGKFYRPNLALKLPVYLEDTLQQRLLELAQQRNQSFSELASDLIKKELLIEGL